MSIVGSGKTNMLKLIIENDPSKLQISQVEHKMKTYERFYENSKQNNVLKSRLRWQSAFSFLRE